MDLQVLSCLLLLLIIHSNGLRCRTGNEDVNENYKRAIDKCIKSDDNSWQSDENSSSDGGFMNEKFYSKKEKSSRRFSPKSNRFKRQTYQSNISKGYQDHQFNAKQKIDGRFEENNDKCNAFCIFNEMKLVDQRGFADRISMTRTMVKGIQDPNLQDFIEETLTECFHFAGNLGLDKCAFSQNILNCLIDKGREKCDDWDDQ